MSAPLATAIGVQALEQEKLQGKAGQIAGRLAYCDLVILDELGYLRKDDHKRLRRSPLLT